MEPLVEWGFSFIWNTRGIRVGSVVHTGAPRGGRGGAGAAGADAGRLTGDGRTRKA